MTAGVSWTQAGAARPTQERSEVAAIDYVERELVRALPLALSVGQRSQHSDVHSAPEPLSHRLRLGEHSSLGPDLGHARAMIASAAHKESDPEAVAARYRLHIKPALGAPMIVKS